MKLIGASDRLTRLAQADRPTGIAKLRFANSRLSRIYVPDKNKTPPFVLTLLS